MISPKKGGSSTNVAKDTTMDLYQTPGGNSASPLSKMKKQQSSNNQFNNGSKKPTYLTFIVKPDCLS
jgi:hypothetical protein